MDVAEFADRLDEKLDTGAYADVDASMNGLQVGPETQTVETAVFAVDAAEATAEAAVTADADVLVVHHGLSWGGIDRVTGRSYRRLEPLIGGDCALYVSHLPLDGHQELGNAAGVADLLGLTDRAPFGEIGGVHAGSIGMASEGLSAETVESRLDGLDQGPGSTQVLPFGPDSLERIAVLTGSGTDWLEEAVAKGADALVTGEGKQKVYHQAREAGVTVMLAGHYATETAGVQSLQELADGWGLDTGFIDHPTGL
jgi:dinuclear metal center protein, YbgI/SA1388 family